MANHDDLHPNSPTAWPSGLRAHTRTRAMKPAVCVVIVPESHDATVEGALPPALLVRRAKVAPLPGYWTPITGKLEAGEASIDGAIREAQEEIGLRVVPIAEVWGCPTSTHEYWLDWWLATARIDDAITLKVDEVDDARWMSPRQIVDRTLTPIFDDTVEFFGRFDAVLSAIDRS